MLIISDSPIRAYRRVCWNWSVERIADILRDEGSTSIGRRLYCRLQGIGKISAGPATAWGAGQRGGFPSRQVFGPTEYTHVKLTLQLSGVINIITGDGRAGSMLACHMGTLSVGRKC
jgi:hypothetical protein